jgi:hypothetical protein
MEGGPAAVGGALRLRLEAGKGKRIRRLENQKLRRCGPSAFGGRACGRWRNAALEVGRWRPNEFGIGSAASGLSEL